jgi:hypothetical protein
VEISVTLSRVAVAFRDLHVGEYVHHGLQHYGWQQCIATLLTHQNEN